MRLIDADELLKKMLLLPDKIAVVEAPTVDAEPARHERPVICNRPISAAHVYITEKPDGTHKVNYDGIGERLKLHGMIENNPVEYCSGCNARLDDNFKFFCPRCGAKIDGEIDPENT